MRIFSTKNVWFQRIVWIEVFNFNKQLLARVQKDAKVRTLNIARCDEQISTVFLRDEFAPSQSSRKICKHLLNSQSVNQRFILLILLGFLCQMLDKLLMSLFVGQNETKRAQVIIKH